MKNTGKSISRIVRKHNRHVNYIRFSSIIAIIMFLIVMWMCRHIGIAINNEKDAEKTEISSAEMVKEANTENNEDIETEYSLENVNNTIENSSIEEGDIESDSGGNAIAISNSEDIVSSEVQFLSSETPIDLTSSLKYHKIIVDGEEIASGDNGVVINALTNFDLNLQFIIDTIATNRATSYYYNLPSQIKLREDIVNLEITDAETGEITAYYSITKDGYVTINVLEQVINDNQYCTINLDLDVIWNVSTPGKNEINFGDTEKYIVDIDTNTIIDVEKARTRRRTNRRQVDYQIRIEPYTNVTDVTLEDIAQTSSKYGRATGKATFIIGEKIIVTHRTAGGSDKVIEEIIIENENTLAEYLSNKKFDLNSGDVLKIKYPMEFKEDAAWDADINDDNLILKNEVSVKSNFNTTPITVKSEDFIYDGYPENIMNKTSSIISDSITKWEVTFNSSNYYTVDSNTIISDSLQSIYLSYDITREFTVVVYTQSGEELRTDKISWDEVISNDKKSWTYNLPKSDYNNLYKYVITYYTKTDPSYEEGEELRNNASAKIHDLPQYSVSKTIDTMNFGVVKNGILNKEKNTIDWEAKYIVFPNCGTINDFRIVDYLPSYTNSRGEKVYSEIIDKNGNIYEGNGEFWKDAIDMTITQYAGSTNYTNNSDFSSLKNDWYVYLNEEIGELVLLNGNWYGFNLPAAKGVYSSGYVITLKYTTLAEDCPEGTILTNEAAAAIDNGKYWYDYPANVRFEEQTPENSIVVEKNAEYYETDDDILYTVNIDESKHGLIGANKMTWVDTFDSRLQLENKKMTLTLDELSSSGKTEIDILFYEDSTCDPPSVKIDENTFSRTFSGISNSQSDGENLTITASIDNTNNIISIDFNRIPVESMTLKPVKYTLQYHLNTKEKGYGTWANLRNTFRIYGNDDSIIYGQGESTYTLKRSVLEKSYRIRKSVNNTVEFRIEAELNSALLSQTELIFEDTMSDSLIPDLDTLKLKLNYNDERAYTFTEKNSMYYKYKELYKKTPNASVTTNWPMSNIINVNLNLGTDRLENYVNAAVNYVNTTYGYNLVPEDFKLVLTYEAKIKGNYGTNVKISNKADLRGVDNSDSEVSFEHTVVGGGASSSTMSTSFTIKKQSGSSTSTDFILLEGAKYKLFDENNTEIAEGTTNGNGELSFGTTGNNLVSCILYTYTPYYIVEVEAPTDYVLDSTPYRFYIEDNINGKDKDGNVVTEEKLNELENKGYTSIDMSDTVIRTNLKTSSLVITKIDENTQNVLKDAEFKLYTDENATVEFQKSLNLDNGTYAFTELEPNTNYYLKETVAPKGYQRDLKIYIVTVSSDGIVKVDNQNLDKNDNTYHFPNQKIIYTLPTTGGVGEINYIIFGLGIILTSSLLLLTKFRKNIYKR